MSTVQKHKLERNVPHRSQEALVAHLSHQVKDLVYLHFKSDGWEGNAVERRKKILDYSLGQKKKKMIENQHLRPVQGTSC